MKLMSWNVNGLRALHKKGNFSWLIKNSPDFFCLQEVKAHPDQLIDDIKKVEGYYAYFDFPTIKKGYSGVAVFTKKEPSKVVNGMGIEDLDQEGRMLTLYYDKFVLINGYFPNGGGAPERLEYKLKFYDAFLKYIEKIRKSGKSIIFCGDINVAHEEIDLARPKENEEHVGFLPEERAWMDEVINHGYIDTYRYFFPTKTAAYTYWDIKSAARERNVGWRIDYFFISPDLVKNLQGVKIHDNVYGSDHCPIELDIKDM
jgi:exodeoxyribonuclease-3